MGRAEFISAELRIRIVALVSGKLGAGDRELPDIAEQHKKEPLARLLCINEAAGPVLTFGRVWKRREKCPFFLIGMTCEVSPPPISPRLIARTWKCRSAMAYGS